MNMQEKIESVSLNGVEYIRKDAQPSGNRAVVVVDRGWIFAGDIERKDGRIFIRRAVHVFRWESIGFSGMIEQPKSNKVTLKPITDVELPSGAEIFCVPVSENWGL